MLYFVSYFMSCRTDPDSIYQLFAEVVQVTAGEYSIHQQYPTDNIDNVNSITWHYILPNYLNCVTCSTHCPFFIRIFTLLFPLCDIHITLIFILYFLVTLRRLSIICCSPFWLLAIMALSSASHIVDTACPPTNLIFHLVYFWLPYFLLYHTKLWMQRVTYNFLS